MKNIRFVIHAIIALAALMVATSVHADSKPKPTPFVPHHTVIGSVSADSITVNTFTGSKSYKIDKYTVITYEGETKTVSDLKPGMKVSVVAGTDPDVASEINASAPPKDPAPAKSPAKK